MTQTCSINGIIIILTYSGFKYYKNTQNDYLWQTILELKAIGVEITFAEDTWKSCFIFVNISINF